MHGIVMLAYRCLYRSHLQPTCAASKVFDRATRLQLLLEMMMRFVSADDIEVAVNELSPRLTQSIERATMSPVINALIANATVR